MRKIIFSLLILMMAVIGASCTGIPAVAIEKEGTVIQTMDAVHLLSCSQNNPIGIKKVSIAVEIAPPSVKEVSVEEHFFCENIPLTYDEQDWLQSACEEFDIPYTLALGLIEKETTFKNIICDNGASTGYMQVQKRWHWDRMERLGVTDLSDPLGNFRVGCDFLSELYEKHDDWSVALTVYNMGHDPGFVTNYAKDVMANCAHWQELLENYI